MFPRRGRFPLFVLLLLGTLSVSQYLPAYSLNGYPWATGSEITMHLSFVRPPINFQDGSASWAASATDALTIWNQYLDQVRFVAAGPVVADIGDGLNSVFFSTDMFGDPFPYNVLAVTLHHRQGTVLEADIIFNSAFSWDSYRGPLQRVGTTNIHDFHRTALHEFGHALGLGHVPQHVVAIMTPAESDLDHLADDDIAGARFLYGSRITSSLNPPAVQSGNLFSYQLTASNNPTSFSAAGLPPGYKSTRLLA